MLITMRQPMKSCFPMTLLKILRCGYFYCLLRLLTMIFMLVICSVSGRVYVLIEGLSSRKIMRNAITLLMLRA
ncbi:hypothetical protein A9513_004670 [Pseudomonas sp. AU12215]|nr:hypothetical protein A9513_004670 [Pseudomonas sp. AU12215]